MSAPLTGTASAAGAISRVRYTHDAMIDLLISRPGVAQNEIAKYFGYTVGWVSRVVNSDAFQARLALRKEDITDPLLIQSFEERLKGLANQSLEIIQNKLDATANPDLAIKALELSTKALGMGARPERATQVSNTFVVALPPKVENEGDWASGALAGARRHVMTSSGVNAVPMSAKITDLIQDVEPKPQGAQNGTEITDGQNHASGQAG